MANENNPGAPIPPEKPEPTLIELLAASVEFPSIDPELFDKITVGF